MKTQSTINHLDLGTASRVRSANRSGMLMPAIVQEVFFNKASVRLGANGAFLRNLPIVGGPVHAGDAVNVDFTSPQPKVVAIGQDGLTADNLLDALKGLQLRDGDGSTQILITLFSGGIAVAMFPPSTDGLTSAIGAATSGDIVWLPDIQVEANVSVPDGVTVAGVSSRESIIEGTVTLGNNSCLENLKVVASSPFSDIIGAQVNATLHQAIIRNCEIHAYQCLDGDAWGIQMNANASLLLDHSLVVGWAAAGDSYAIDFGVSGKVNSNYTQFYGITDWFTGTGTINECADTDGFHEADLWCNIDNYFPNVGFSNIPRNVTSPIPGDLKVSFELASASSISLATNSNNSYLSKFTRSGDYIYCKVLGSNTIREISVADGSATDILLSGFAPDLSYTIVGDRTLLAVTRISEDITVHKLDFSSSSVTTELAFDRSTDPLWPDGVDNEEVYGMNIAVTKNDNGDLVVVLYGGIDFYEWIPALSDWDYHEGLYVRTKNWSQSGDWSDIIKTQMFDSSLNYYEEQISPNSFSPWFVGRRYLVLQANSDGVEVGNYSSSTTLNDTWAGMWVFDFETSDLTYTFQHYASTDPTWGGTFTFYPTSIGVDHVNSLLFAVVITNAGYNHVFKFDVVNKTITDAFTGSVALGDINIFYNNSNCWFLVPNDSDGTTWTLYQAYDQSVINSSWAPPTSGAPHLWLDWYPTDRSMSDQNLVWVFIQSHQTIAGMDLRTGSVSEFNLDFDAQAYGNSWLFAFGDAFILVNQFNAAPHNYYWRLIKEG
jgi:hypothetical protein